MSGAEYYLGIDLGSVSTNIVAMDEGGNIVEKLYLRTGGKPINVLLGGIQKIGTKLGSNAQIKGVGTTGSGRQLASVIIGADVVKNEITAHSVATKHLVPDVKTIMEIGGQDSKIIFLRNGVVYDFAMNTVCAAGTGSFIDRQASRLDISIENFGGYALRADAPVRIAGRCAVFAESDMIHKQQTGHSIENIVAGLCEALVRNYFNNLAKGKEIEFPVVFQGGVAANIGIVNAFERELGKKIIIPEHHDVMGAYGCALLARTKIKSNNKRTAFHGFKSATCSYHAKSTECCDCPNMCEIIEICLNEKPIARWGDRCGKWGVKEESSEVV